MVLRVWLCALAAALLALAAPDAESASKKKPAPSLAGPEMQVVIVRAAAAGCEPACPQWISAEGQITARTPAAFKKALAKLGKRKLPVVLSSPGGDVDAALAIGRIVRARGLDVIVGRTDFSGCAPGRKDCKLPKSRKGVYRGGLVSLGAYCFSACPFVLAAGVERLVAADTFVGVHQMTRTVVQERVNYLEKYRIVNGRKKVVSRKVVGRKKLKSYTTTEMDASLRERLTAYLDEMGVERRLLDLLDEAPPTAIHLIAGPEAAALGLATGSEAAGERLDPARCREAKPAAFCVGPEPR
jgi:hypothetical protein